MGMWDWFRHRLHPHRRAELSSHNNEPDGAESYNRDSSNWPFTSCFNRTGGPKMRFGNCSPAKCLSRLQFSQILYGERLEDFSPDCWLENHLHRFGGPGVSGHNDLDNAMQRVNSYAMPDLDIGDDSITSSSEEEDRYSTDDNHSGGTLSNLDSVMFHERPRLHIEELFMSPEERDSVIDSPSGYRQIIAPPAYCEFPNDPPPTYAEAVGHESENGSVSSGRWSVDSTFLW